jgi:hypothetical protein
MKNNDDTPTNDTNEIKHLINRVKQGELDQGDALLIEKLLNFLLTIVSHLERKHTDELTDRAEEQLRAYGGPPPSPGLGPANASVIELWHVLLSFSGTKDAGTAITLHALVRGARAPRPPPLHSAADGPPCGSPQHRDPAPFVEAPLKSSLGG